jgi:lipopolysaccharide/colanic/teichoic acid biosynthesis glycosyltransferase
VFALVGRRGSAWRNLWSAVRRSSDMLVALVGLAVALPFFPLVAALIRLDSPGPIIYRQKRVGRFGAEFWVPKLRSMVQDAEANGAVWATQGDRRITRVGRLLRRTHLDEFPQLWTILLGHMSLIGPRPERPEFVRELEHVIPYYSLRHAIRPGLTGWAQVRYPYGSSVEDAVAKLEYDLYYLKNRGPLLDGLVALRTVRAALLMQGT